MAYTTEEKIHPYGIHLWAKKHSQRPEYKSKTLSRTTGLEQRNTMIGSFFKILSPSALAKNPLASWGIQTAFSAGVWNLPIHQWHVRDRTSFWQSRMRRQMVPICIGTDRTMKPTFPNQKAEWPTENEYPVFLKKHNCPFPTIDV